MSGRPPKRRLPTLHTAGQVMCTHQVFLLISLKLPFNCFNSCWLFSLHAESHDPINRMVIVFAPTLEAWLSADNESGNGDDGQPQHELHIRGLEWWIISCPVQSSFGVCVLVCVCVCACVSFLCDLELTSVRLREQNSVKTITGKFERLCGLVPSTKI